MKPNTLVRATDLVKSRILVRAMCLVKPINKVRTQKEETMNEKPKMRDRKHPRLYQAYQWWYELVELRKRHTLRISAIEREDSNLDLQTERDIMEIMGLDSLIAYAAKEMAGFGASVGPIWQWLLDIKGIGTNLAGKLIANIDDINRFATVSKLWAFSGWAVRDGRREYNQKGKTSGYNHKLKSICWQIGDSFLKQQTPVYTDVYYVEKERLQRLHPDTLCRDCKELWSKEHKAKGHKQMYNPLHLHNMAQRKMVKIFLQHLWVRWRESEGLPVTAPYAEAILGHTNIVRVVGEQING